MHAKCMVNIYFLIFFFFEPSVSVVPRFPGAAAASSRAIATSPSLSVCASDSAAASPGAGTILGAERTALYVRLASGSISSSSVEGQHTGTEENHLRGERQGLLGKVGRDTENRRPKSCQPISQ